MSEEVRERLERLAAENEETVAVWLEHPPHEHNAAGPAEIAADIRTLLAQSTEDAARIEALEGALKAFSDAIADDEGEWLDREEIWELPLSMEITVGDLRRARALLTGGTEG